VSDDPDADHPAFLLRPCGNADIEQHYELLRSLSNCQVPQDPQGNEHWLRNRRDFDEAARTRRHYLAIESATVEPVGYASIEQQATGSPHFRMFLVFDPQRFKYGDLGDFLYRRLHRDAIALKAQTLTLIEYASDLPFLSFLKQQGFVEVGHFQYDGFDVVRLEKSL
jgi:hypothetical protein